MSDNIQLIVNGAVVFQSGVAPDAPPVIAPPAGPPVSPPTPSPVVNSTSTRQVMPSVILVDGINKQLQSSWFNSGYPMVDTVAFPFDIPPEATGTRVAEFTNASYATNASMRAAISRSPDDAMGTQGYALAGHSGYMMSGNIEFAVNGGAGEIVLGSGRWYLVVHSDDLPLLRALPGGYQADRLAWFRDTTAR